MSAQSPMGSDAAFAVIRDPGTRTLIATFNDGAGQGDRTIARAVSTDPSDEADFYWLIRSAAAFHDKPCKDLR